MNKEEDYRNLAVNITMFTDNTSFYEDWLVIQQYVDDWLDEIDKLQQENKQLKENNLAMQEEMARTWEKEDKLKSVLKEIREYIKDNISQEFRNGRQDEFYLELNEKKLKILLEIIDKGIGEDK